MKSKLIIFALFVIGVSLIVLLLKFIGYSFKARKYGTKTKAKFIGYYRFYDYQGSFMWYPVVSFYNLNGKEIIARSKCYMSIPLYKIGDEFNIKYYSNDFYTTTEKEVNPSGFSSKKETVNICKNVKFNILDFKHIMDSVIEIIISIILLLIIIML